MYLPMREKIDDTIPALGPAISHLSVADGEPQLATGPFGFALYLDGTSAVLLGDRRDSCIWSPDLCQDGLTFTMWIKVTEYQGEKYVLSNGGQTRHSYGLALLLKNGYVYVTVSTPTQKGSISCPSDLVVDGKWHHVAVTFHWPSKAIALYIDGTEKDSGTLNTVFSGTPTSFNGMYLGCPNNALGNYNYYLEVWIDEVLFWDKYTDSAFIGNVYHSQLCTYHKQV